MIRGCAPQRQIFPCRNWIISEDVGLGFACRSATLLMIIPGVQKAHWKAPASRKACCTGCRRPSFSSPSMVVIDFPTPALTWTWQERRGAPSIKTVHAPHCPSPQPYLLPVRPSSSRSTVNREVSGGYRTGNLLPFTSSSISAGILPPFLQQTLACSASPREVDVNGGRAAARSLSRAMKSFHRLKWRHYCEVH